MKINIICFVYFNQSIKIFQEILNKILYNKPLLGHNKNMTKKQRRILFYICVLIFILSGPIITFYSFGWRFDFKNFKILPSGALYLKTNRSGVKVYLNNKFKKESNNLPFFNSIFIKNLAPKYYNIKVKKNGYLTWEKKLKINPELVTEAENIFLLPEKIPSKIVSENILKNSNFIFSKNQKNFYWLSKKNNFLILNVFNLEKPFLKYNSDLEISTYKLMLYPKNTIRLNDISYDNKKILLKNENNRWFLYDIKKQKLIDLNKNLENFFQKIDKIQFHPYKDGLLIFAFNNLYEMNLKNLTLSFPILKNILYYKLFKNSIYFIDENFSLSKTELYNLNTKKIISIKSLIKTKIPVFNLTINNEEQIALIINSKLYLIETKKQKKPQFIKDGVILMKFSNNGEKLAFTDKENMLYIYYLKNIINKQPNKYKAELDKIINLKETTFNIFWFYKNNYLLLVSDHKVIFCEIDNRDKINHYIIFTGDIQNSYFNSYDNNLYLNLGNFKIIKMEIK